MFRVPRSPAPRKPRATSSRAKCPNVALERPKLSWLCADGSRVLLNLEKQYEGVFVTLETSELTATLPATPFILASICRKIQRRALA